MDAAAYYRVSSKSQNLGMQEHAVQKLAASKGDAITVVYAEKLTGKRMDRPELQRLLLDAQCGRLPPRLYVFRYDRLSRSNKIRHLLEVVDVLQDAGVEVISTQDGFPVAGPIGQMVLAAWGCAAAIEASAGEERRAASREEREAKGLPFGRPPRLQANDPRLPGALDDLQQHRRTLRELAVAFKVPKATLHRHLKRLALSQKSAAEPASGS